MEGRVTAERYPEARKGTLSSMLGRGGARPNPGLGGGGLKGQGLNLCYWGGGV